MKNKLKKLIFAVTAFLSVAITASAKGDLPDGVFARIAYSVKRFGPMPKMMLNAVILLAVMIIVTVLYYRKTGGSSDE